MSAPLPVWVQLWTGEMNPRWLTNVPPQAMGPSQKALLTLSKWPCTHMYIERCERCWNPYQIHRSRKSAVNPIHGDDNWLLHPADTNFTDRRASSPQQCVLQPSSVQHKLEWIPHSLCRRKRSLSVTVILNHGSVKQQWRC
jgi:hypothetical protein